MPYSTSLTPAFVSRLSASVHHSASSVIVQTAACSDALTVICPAVVLMIDGSRRFRKTASISAVIHMRDAPSFCPQRRLRPPTRRVGLKIAPRPRQLRRNSVDRAVKKPQSARQMCGAGGCRRTWGRTGNGIPSSAKKSLMTRSGRSDCHAFVRDAMTTYQWKFS